MNTWLFSTSGVYYSLPWHTLFIKVLFCVISNLSINNKVCEVQFSIEAENGHLGSLHYEYLMRHGRVSKLRIARVVHLRSAEVVSDVCGMTSIMGHYLDWTLLKNHNVSILGPWLVIPRRRRRGRSFLCMTHFLTAIPFKVYCYSHEYYL